MSGLTKLESAQLRTVQETEGWSVLERKLKERIQQILGAPIMGVDAFQELRELHRKQGAVDALRQFFEDVEQQAFDDEQQ